MISDRAIAYQSRFTTGRAASYDRRRAKEGMWLHDARIVRALLDDLPAGTKLLDCPIGTGRFLPYYASRDFSATGIDTSRAMLDKARKRRLPARLIVGSVFDLPLHDGAVDVAVCIRLFHQIEPSDQQQALRELCRVARRRVVFTTTSEPRKGLGGCEACPPPGWYVCGRSRITTEWVGVTLERRAC